MKRLSKITEGLIGQPMFKLMARINKLERSERRRIIHFEIGDPNFPTPGHVVQAAKDSLEKGETHYTDSMGLRDLRQEICKYTEKSLGFAPSVEQVLVTPANAIIDFVIRCVANPGEEIMYPNPGFPTYYSVINYAGMKPISIPIKEENGFRPDPEHIRRNITDKTRLIIINSPHNPTGSMMTKKQIKEIADIAKERDIFLLSDEVYSKVIYDKPHYSPSIYDQCKERIISLNSFSKIYSMSGWRVGYAIGPQSLITKMGLLLQTTISCLPVFTQRGAQAALVYEQTLVEDRNMELRRRRDAITEGLNSIPGIRCAAPDGAFYIFASIEGTGLTSEEIVELFLEKANVAVLNGNCFGGYGEGYIRLCYASTDIDTIQEALKNMREALRQKKDRKKLARAGGLK